jgi:hypothetical protein
MRSDCPPGVDTTILDAASLLALALGGAALDAGPPPVAADPAVTGEWLSADGTVRLRLESDGRYESRVAGRDRAARGTYRVDGTAVLLHDDSGLRITVTRLGDALEMAGYDLRRA